MRIAAPRGLVYLSRAVLEADEELNVFSPVSKTQWVEKVEAELKGKPLDILQSRTPGGLTLRPLYTEDDAPQAGSTGVPGGFPYCRGTSPTGGWLVRQEYGDPRLEVCAGLIAEDLERGVEALWVTLGPSRGCRVLTVADLDTLFASVDLAKTSVHLEAGSDSLAVAAAFLALAEKRNHGVEALRGALCFDPIGELASEGGLRGGLDARLAELRELAVWGHEHAAGLRTVCVDANVYHESGASEVQELAWSIATGVEYLRQLVSAGLGVDDAAQKILFRFASSGEFFVQIAKLRAARWLWAKVVSAAGGGLTSAAMQMHCRSSERTKARRDPWVNMLRVTAECTAAVLGGAQSVATLPFDAVIGPADELARRVARNTQIVLRDESNLDKVADPAGGSWFIESLTEELARAAWEQFRAIEAGGGLLSALKSGQLADELELVVGSERRRVATRHAPILGVSEFPNLDEAAVERQPVSLTEVEEGLKRSIGSVDPLAHREALAQVAAVVRNETRKPGELMSACLEAMRRDTDLYSLATVLRHGQPDLHVPPMSKWRPATAWEQLRDRSDRHAEKAGARPSAFMANLGPVPSHKARSVWATNLLAAAGIASVGNDGFATAEAVAEAFRASGQSLAVLCGSDEDYSALLEPCIKALNSAGCSVILVAGRPKKEEAALREAGVTDFLFQGADVLETARRTLDALGVNP